LDDDDAKHVLLNIRRMVTGAYPFYQEIDTIDARYAKAFGLIFNLCTEALQAKQQNRPMRIETALRTPSRSHEN
jgi:hypothetical protein